jgi:CRISPR-associated RAMP protein (TIGR02581 family)
MLRKLVNQAEVSLILEPDEPLLVASAIPNAAGIDLPFVLTYRSGSDVGEPYLPGSSLKGVLRSHTERLSRTFAPNARVCDPHLHDSNRTPSDRVLFCGDRLRPRRDQGASSPLASHDLYKGSCPICRTFGSTMYRGRFSIGDAYLQPGERAVIERRDGVGIDRFSGGASRGVKFEMEVLTRGKFSTRMRIENFEDWQLGILALLTRDLADKFISIGHSTTRGLGRLKAQIERFDVMYVVPPSKALTPDRIHGVGSLLSDAERGGYDYHREDYIALSQPMPLTDKLVRRVQSFGEDARSQLFADAVARWATRMETWGQREVAA